MPPEPPPPTTAARRVSLRPIALPNEHGAWGFLFEPALLGLILAPTPAGALLAVAATFGLLAQHPLRLALADARRGRRYPRTRVALRFALGYGALALVALAAALALVGRIGVLIPALLAAPAALLHLAYGARLRGRDLLPELAGAGAMGALAACIALADGWALGAALTLWALLTLRTVPSILYVRARLRLKRGEATPALPSLLAHALALGAAALLTALAGAPPLALAAYALLLLRAALGLSRSRRPAKAKTIGMLELGFGVVLVALVAVGYGLVA